jgi:hypothetical protein
VKLHTVVDVVDIHIMATLVQLVGQVVLVVVFLDIMLVEITDMVVRVFLDKVMLAVVQTVVTTRAVVVVPVKRERVQITNQKVVMV